MQDVSSRVFAPCPCLPEEPTQGNKFCHSAWKAKCLGSDWHIIIIETNILMDSEINTRDKTQLQQEGRFFFSFFFLLRGHGRLEIVRCKQVKIEHTATLITLLADREVQLRPWEGNYSHNVWKADKRDGERERTSGGGRKGGGETNERKMYKW